MKFSGVYGDLLALKEQIYLVASKDLYDEFRSMLHVAEVPLTRSEAWALRWALAAGIPSAGRELSI